MDLSHTDLLKLLSVLEGELQAREVVIAVLKAEQTKSLLYPNSPIRNLRAKSLYHLTCNYNDTTINNDTTNQATVVPKSNNKLLLGTNFKSTVGCYNNRSRISSNDPYAALFRDSLHAFDPNFDEYTSSVLFHFQLKHLDKLIENHQLSSCLMKNQLTEVTTKLNSIFAELEDEKRRSESFDRKKMEEQLDQLMRENESLRCRIIQLTTAFDLEKEREKKMILHLLSERKQLIMKLIEKHQENTHLITINNSNEGKMSEMIEGLEDESKRSLQMELEVERLTSEHKLEIEQLKRKLSLSETHNQLLQSQLDKLTNGSTIDTSINDNNIGKSKQQQQISSSSCNSGIVKVTPGSSQQQYSLSSSSSSSMMTGTIVRANRSNVQVTAAAFHNQSYNPNSEISSSSSCTSQLTDSCTSNIKQVGHLSLAKNSITKSQSIDSCVVSTLTPIMSTSSSSSSTTATTATSNSTTNVTTGAKVSVAAAVAAVEEKVTQIMTKAPIIRKISTGSVTSIANSTATSSSLTSSSSSVLRGAPPPVPPNKPILPAQVLKEKSKLITQQSLPLKSSSSLSSSSSSSSSLPSSSTIEGETSSLDIIYTQAFKNESSTSNLPSSPSHNNSITSKSRLPIKIFTMPSVNSVNLTPSSSSSSNGKLNQKNQQQTIHTSEPNQSINTINSVENHFAPELADFHKALVSDVKAVNI